MIFNGLQTRFARPCGLRVGRTVMVFTNKISEVNDVRLGSGRFDLAFEMPLFAQFEFSSDIFEPRITGRMIVVDKDVQNSENPSYCLLNAAPN